MNKVEQVNSTSRFIGLEMPDEVPARRLAPHFGNLLISLLDAIFSYIYCSKFDHPLYSRRRMGLADGDEFYFFGLAATAFGSRFDTRANACKSFCQTILRRVVVCQRVHHMESSTSDSIHNHNNPEGKRS